MKKSLILTSLLAIMGIASTAGAVGTPAGTTISNIGYFDYADPTSPTGTSTQATTPVDITVQQVYDIDITPDGTVNNPGQTVAGVPGSPAVLTYTISNTGNGNDTINLTATVISGGTGTPVIYIDTNNNGTYNPGTDQPSNNVSLSANNKQVVFVVYPVPANVAGNITIYTDLQGVSSNDVAATDTSNVGAITTNTIISMTLVDDRTVTTTPGAAVIATHTLTNTGNVTIDPTTLVATSSIGGSNQADSSTVSYTVVNSATGASITNTDLDTALSTAGNLPMGSTYTITVTYTPTTSAANGDSYTNQIKIHSNVADSSSVNNINDSNAPVTNTDTIKIIKGVTTVSKTGVNCGTDSTCSNPTASSAAKPGDFLKYTVTVTNSGSAGVPFPTLRDYVPANTTFSSMNGSSTPAGTILYSSDRLNWSSTAPTNVATSTSSSSGPWVFVGLDSSNDGMVNTSDILAPNQTMQLTITVKVN